VEGGEIGEKAGFRDWLAGKGQVGFKGAEVLVIGR
jgi:hypothetical protein